MENQEETAKVPTTQKKIEEMTKAVPQDATIIFEIPAYKDKDTGESFRREVVVTTNKAYAVYKSLIRWKYPD